MAKNIRAGTSPFAHLLALVTGSTVDAKRGDEEKPDEGAETEELEEGAEDEELEENAEEETPDEPEEKQGKRGKKAKAEEDDDSDERAESDDDDDDMAKARREGFAAAQARGRKIFSAASAALRPDMAAHLAFSETSPSAAAIAMLDMAASGIAPAGRGSRLGNRMARVVIPNPGSGPTGKKPEEQSFGEMAKAAGKKAGIFSE